MIHLRENVPILLLGIIILALFGVYCALPGKGPAGTRNATASSPSPELSAADLKILEKVDLDLENGSYSAALSSLGEVKKPSSLQVQVMSAEARAFLGKSPEVSFEELEKGVRKDRGLHLVYRLARAFEGAGKPEKALEYYKVLLAARLPSQLKTRVANRSLDLAMARNDENAAVAAFTSLAAEGGYTAKRLRSFLLFLRGRRAYGMYDHFAGLAERKFPRNADLLNFLGKTAMERSRRADARRLFERAVALRMNDAYAHYNLYQVYALEGRKDQAFESLDSACGGDFSTFPASETLQPSFLLKMAMTAGKEKAFRQGYHFARSALTSDIKLLGQADEAVLKALFEYGQSRSTPEEQAFHAVFDLFINGDFKAVDAALPALEKKIRNSALRRDFHHMRLACRRIIAGDEAALEEERERQRREEEERAALMASKAQAEAALAAPENPGRNLPEKKPPSEVNAKQIAKLKEELQTKTHDSDAMLDGGQKILALGDNEGAREIFNQVVQRKPGLPEGCYHLARMLRLQGEGGQAADLVRQAINGNGREAKYRGLSALLLADQEDWYRAEEEAKKALAINPRNGEARLALMRRFVAARDFPAAGKELEIAVQSPNPLVMQELEKLKAEFPQLKK